uniref:Uncharacterized protein n=1 Tax=Kalanchoe fedtschenkoi TaxID=63787 RepID=A0A7N0T597_KALFE
MPDLTQLLIMRMGMCLPCLLLHMQTPILTCLAMRILRAAASCNIYEKDSRI